MRTGLIALCFALLLLFIIQGVSAVECDGLSFEIEEADHHGGDYKDVGDITDVCECAKLCENDDKCLAFALITSTKRCYLKDKVNPRENEPGTYTGIKENGNGNDRFVDGVEAIGDRNGGTNKNYISTLKDVNLNGLTYQWANWNIGSVRNGPPEEDTTFSISEPVTLKYIDTYHWNNGKGVDEPGEITIIDSNGKEYGPWQASGKQGQGGVPNALWVVKPNVKLPAGKYIVIDSDPDTWSNNKESGNAGFAGIQCN